MPRVLVTEPAVTRNAPFLSVGVQRHCQYSSHGLDGEAELAWVNGLNFDTVQQLLILLVAGFSIE